MLTGCACEQCQSGSHLVLQGINLFCPLPEQVLLTQAVLFIARQPVLHILVFLPLLCEHLYLAILGLHCMPHVVHLCYMLSHSLRQDTTRLQSKGEGCIAHGSASDPDDSQIHQYLQVDALSAAHGTAAWKTFSGVRTPWY